MSATEGAPNLLEEWKQARETIKTYDEKLHDLRKYGFTFVTGLLTAQGLLLPGGIPGEPAIDIPPKVQFAILSATMLLIIVLRWFDGNYQGIIYAINARAIVIERLINLELTEEIQDRFRASALWLSRNILYTGFEFAVVFLAFVLLPSEHTKLTFPPTWDDWVTILSIVVVIEWVIYFTLFTPGRSVWGHISTDWTLDRLQCERGQQIRLMMTNFSGRIRFFLRLKYPIFYLHLGRIKFEKNKVIWQIYDSNNKKMHCQTATTDLIVERGSSYVWNWTANVEPGIYTIKICQPDYEARELDKKLNVLPSENRQYQFFKVGQRDQPLKFVINNDDSREIVILLSTSGSNNLAGKLTVEVSVNNIDWTTVDEPELPSAQHYSHLYNQNTLATKLRVNPGSFPYIRVTVPAVHGGIVTTFISLSKKEGE